VFPRVGISDPTHDGAAPSMKHVHATACPMDCPDACSLSATIEDGRVTALEGSTANPFTAGFMCSKMKRYPERMYGADRLTQPLIRDGAKGSGSFRAASWEEALDLVAHRLRAIHDAHGGERDPSLRLQRIERRLRIRHGR
jgi:anaerobic selenocysteine-containing dehydrogenase